MREGKMEEEEKEGGRRAVRATNGICFNPSTWDADASRYL